MSLTIIPCKKIQHPIKDDDIVPHSLKIRRSQDKEPGYKRLELVRHRVFSFAQESTRYCNYSKDKFGNEITYIIPNWVEVNAEYEGRDCIVTKNSTDSPAVAWVNSLEIAEQSYNYLIECGCQPQQARAVLPNSLKTEVVMTGFVSDWKHFFDLRDSQAAHPQMRELAAPLHQEFIKRGYI